MNALWKDIGDLQKECFAENEKRKKYDEDIKYYKELDRQMMNNNASQNDLYEEYRLSHLNLHNTFEAEQKEFDELVEDIENQSYIEME